MTEEKKEIIKTIARQLFENETTDLHIIRERIQYGIFWDNVQPPEYYTNDEIFELVNEAING